MHRTRIEMTVWALVVLCALGCSTSAWAQSPGWPSQTIRLIVPYPPGGSPDIVARLLAAQMGERVGQPVIVENRSGANGQIGTDFVASAPADGHTLLLASDGPIVINPLLAGKLAADEIGRLAPVANIAETPFVLLASKAIEARSMAELIALARNRGKPFTIGSSGHGSQHHLAAELLKSAAGIELIHVPYRGFGAAVNDLLSGSIDLLFGSLPAVLPYVQAGNVRALAVAARERAVELPDIPTAAEQQISGLEVSAWFGVMAPRGTHRSVISSISQSIQSSLASGVARERLVLQGMRLLDGNPSLFAERIKADFASWEAVVKRAGLKAN